MKESTPVKSDNCKFVSHSITMTDRKKATMSGVAKVDGAADGEIILTTCMGKLTILGHDLKIAKFDDGDGNLTITGNIDSIKYVAAKAPIIKRLFK